MLVAWQVWQKMSVPGLGGVVGDSVVSVVYGLVPVTTGVDSVVYGSVPVTSGVDSVV